MATITKGRTFLSGETVTPAKINALVDDATISGIVNSEIATGAAIVDTKLATLATPGKVSNSATTAASTNTPNAIVARDGSGNFSAGTITASITGNVSGSSGSCTGNSATATQASNALACSGNAATATLAATCSGNSNTATRLQTPRTINGVSFDGSGNITVTAEPGNLTASRAVISNASGKIAVSTVTDTELGHLTGVTSAIQTQLGNKQATITGAATTINSSNLTASRAVISNASGKIAVSTVTNTELGYLTGVTSAIQTQLDSINKTPVKFPNLHNWVGGNSCGYSSFFLTSDKRLFASGNMQGYYCGLGNNFGNNITKGFRDITPSMTYMGGALTGEWISEFYTNFDSQKFILSNLGNLYSTGKNDHGNLGRNGTSHDYYWGKIAISNVSWFSTSNGQQASCSFAVSNGVLYAWGYNGYGQLGMNNTNNVYFTPTACNGAVVGKTITKVFACGCESDNTAYVFAIDNNRNVYGAGYNAGGQLGTGNVATQLSFVQIFRDAGNTIPQKADKILSKSWSSNGNSFFLDGTDLYGCGSNNYGALGKGNDTNQASNYRPTLILSNVSDVATSGYYNGTIMALMTNGSLKTWGRNNQGACGNGNTTDIYTPYTAINSGISKIISVGTRDYATNYAMLTDGRILAAGYNGHGQLGLGNNSQNNYFNYIRQDLNNTRFVDWSPWCDVNSGIGLTLLTDNGQLYTIGYTASGCGGWTQEDHDYPWVPMRSHII